MLIIALVLAVIGLASLVAAVVTSNELIVWVCIGASVIGVLLLIVDALRDRSRGDTEDEDSEDSEDPETAAVQDYPDEPAAEVEEVPADAPDLAPEAETESGAEPGAEHK